MFNSVAGSHCVPSGTDVLYRVLRRVSALMDFHPHVQAYNLWCKGHTGGVCQA